MSELLVGRADGTFARPGRATGIVSFDRARGGSLADLDLDGARRAGSRHFARQCLDWSERRPHISGALGSAIADVFFKRGWAERMRRGRTVRLTDQGRRALARDFGATV